MIWSILHDATADMQIIDEPGEQLTFEAWTDTDLIVVHIEEDHFQLWCELVGKVDTDYREKVSDGEVEWWVYSDYTIRRDEIMNTDNIREYIIAHLEREGIKDITNEVELDMIEDIDQEQFYYVSLIGTDSDHEDLFPLSKN